MVTRKRHPTPLFPLGQVVATPGLLDSLSASETREALGRHLHGDWGEVDDADWQANDVALQDGSRLLSAYRTRDGGRKFWIITEADRSSTTLLWPDEY